MDASQYKDYVLVLLFVKYVSDKFVSDPDSLIEIPEGGGFADMVALDGDKEIGEKINIIIARLAETFAACNRHCDAWEYLSPLTAKATPENAFSG
jgi:type I restriction-modification system DNA methylase subunit